MEFKGVNVDLLQTFVVVLIEGDIDFLCNGGTEKLALRPLCIGNKEKTVEESSIFLGKHIPSFQSILILIGKILSDIYLSCI